MGRWWCWAGVSCWTTFLCSCGGWCRRGGGVGGSGIIVALRGIMNGLLFARSLRPHPFFIPAERNGGRAARQRSGGELKMSDAPGAEVLPGRGPATGGRCPPRRTSDAHAGVAASQAEAGGCPNPGDDEDGDDGDAHNGGIHVAPWSQSCVCVGCRVQRATQHLKYGEFWTNRTIRAISTDCFWADKTRMKQILQSPTKSRVSTGRQDQFWFRRMK